MRMSRLFSSTNKEIGHSDISRNAQYLTKAGYVNKLMAGVYSYLPLGLMVLNRIENIIREEMNALGAQEILMPALQPREIWDQTGRWDTVDVLFRFRGQGDRELALGATHEEVVTPLIANFIRSYRDLPIAAYQIQTKFRNEARAKSGLLRGREFRMKDMYSFHDSQADLDQFYEKATDAYHKIFARCGLGGQTLLTFASGGAFSQFSHEFQTLTPYGEDVIYRVPGKNIAINREIIEQEEVLASMTGGKTAKDLEELKAIEVGNIFKLSTRFTDAFSRTYADKDGKEQKIYMGTYGIGSSRLMGTIAECLSDEKGLVWPAEVSPYQYHLVSLVRDEDNIKIVDDLYATLTANGVDVLYDDRSLQAGEKLADCDLLGMPNRIVISRNSLAEGAVELKGRTEAAVRMVKLADLPEELYKTKRLSYKTCG